MIFLLLFFLATISESLFVSAAFHREFEEEALPINIGGIPVLLFFIGLLFGLKTAFICVLGIYGGLLVDITARFRL